MGAVLPFWLYGDVGGHGPRRHACSDKGRRHNAIWGAEAHTVGGLETSVAGGEHGGGPAEEPATRQASGWPAMIDLECPRAATTCAWSSRTGKMSISGLSWLPVGYVGSFCTTRTVLVAHLIGTSGLFLVGWDARFLGNPIPLYFFFNTRP